MAKNLAPPTASCSTRNKRRDASKLGFILGYKALLQLWGLRKGPQRRLALRRCIDWLLEHQDESGDWTRISAVTFLDACRNGQRSDWHSFSDTRRLRVHSGGAGASTTYPERLTYSVIRRPFTTVMTLEGWPCASSSGSRLVRAPKAVGLRQ
jgi:hypothetical protein